MHKHLTAILAAGVLFAGGGKAFAQDSVSTQYDTSRPATVVGTVTTISWAYPRAFLLIEGKGANGRLQEYRIDLGNPRALELKGWTRDTVRDGEIIIVNGWYARVDRSRIKARTIQFHGRPSDQVGLTFSQATTPH
jgi:uncharacterized protein DUF6152